MFLKQSCLAVLFALLVAPQENAAETCACAAEELGFEINCGGDAAMLAALSDLQSNSCNTDCASPICVRNWMVVQSHHDYCPEGGLPREIEDDFHDYDSVCKGCDISRKAQAGAEECPIPNCIDNSGNDAYLALAASNCLADCSADTCKTNFLTLRTVHDSCPHDTLSQAAEEILHDYEVPCVQHQCNVASAAGSKLVCDSHDHHDSHDHDDSDSGAGSTTVAVALIATAGAIALM